MSDGLDTIFAGGLGVAIGVLLIVNRGKLASLADKLVPAEQRPSALARGVRIGAIVLGVMMFPVPVLLIVLGIAQEMAR